MLCVKRILIYLFICCVYYQTYGVLLGPCIHPLVSLPPFSPGPQRVGGPATESPLPEGRDEDGYQLHDLCTQASQAPPSGLPSSGGDLHKHGALSFQTGSGGHLICTGNGSGGQREEDLALQATELPGEDQFFWSPVHQVSDT